MLRGPQTVGGCAGGPSACNSGTRDVEHYLESLAPASRAAWCPCRVDAGVISSGVPDPPTRLRYQRPLTTDFEGVWRR
jgi:hypothetical protein